ncbi:flagellar basal-body rod protein FlgB [Thermodesulfitimonas autotrophica]|uniref:Flagellar basal body rod protein FlgB n=1 Tax=Thermodesulfitimonas autotrophica TaxID=1894989 RepID=A0A3N5AE44_9THEO|nr:flagellar basal body rod protein FlgB [Thermodesulfitimonas autotrophica]RPF42914.1 flagellar basal-body rod protein FlgB [Thermodesulfitimonas autotrophica]
MSIFNDPVKVALAKTLDAAALRQRVIADNIANADTPGFKKGTVEFEAALRQVLGGEPLALKTTDPRHIGSGSLSSVAPRVERVTTTTQRTDGNNVDVEEEMINLVTNNLTYQAAVRFISGKFSSLRYVISGGR